MGLKGKLAQQVGQHYSARTVGACRYSAHNLKPIYYVTPNIYTIRNKNKSYQKNITKK